MFGVGAGAQNDEPKGHITSHPQTSNFQYSKSTTVLETENLCERHFRMAFKCGWSLGDKKKLVFKLLQEDIGGSEDRRERETIQERIPIWRVIDITRDEASTAQV
jgi:hypothetical protein